MNKPLEGRHILMTGLRGTLAPWIRRELVSRGAETQAWDRARVPETLPVLFCRILPLLW